MNYPQIYVATKARGIFKNLFTSNSVNAEFILEKNSLTDFSSKNHVYKILSSIFYSKLFDQLGIIQKIMIKGKNTDMYWSYNRFLCSDKPYILYVEHPIALQNYRINRGKSIIGKKVIRKSLKDDNLIAIVFQAKFSEKTFDELIGKYDGIKRQIYPCVQINKYVNIETIQKRSYREKLKLLFVAQGKRFVSKAGPELIKAYEKLVNIYRSQIELYVVTNIDEIDKSYINSNKQIKWMDYKLTKDEMEQLYADSNILVVVSSDDSLNAVALEALKSGLAIISSDMAGFPEIVEQDKNGYLTEPKWQFFDKNCFPNEAVWNHRKETLYSSKIDNRIVDFIFTNVKKLMENRRILEKLSLESWRKANEPPFSEDYVIEQWNCLLHDIEETYDK